MATTSATIAVGSGIPWDGKEKISVFHQRVTATSAKPLVASTVYRVINIPAYSFVERVWIKTATKESSGSKMTVSVTDAKGASKLITSADMQTTAGVYSVISSGSLLGKYVGAAGGTIDITPHTGNCTALVIDVFAKVLNEVVNTTQEADTVYAS